ncbi:MAG: type 1 glutamine amidotransferase [bacterium]|nr:type 1 glutamine amidotransferase [bacterium]
MERKKKILFLDILTDDRRLRRLIHKRLYGGKAYADCIAASLGVRKGELRVVDAAFEELPSRPDDFIAIIIGGSALDPVKKRDRSWIGRSYGFIKKAHARRVPILGICGGLQFTVRALGGSVIFNPKGWHFGTARVSLTTRGMRDPLFKGIPRAFAATCNHRCIAPRMKPGWRRLASSANTQNEAIAIGAHTRLVMFHPERTLSAARASAMGNKEALAKEHVIRVDDFSDFLASLADTSATGKKIMRNFLKHFARR